MNGKRSLGKTLYYVRRSRTGQTGGQRKRRRPIGMSHGLFLEIVLGQLVEVALGIVLLLLGCTAPAPAGEAVDFRDAAAKAISATVSVESRAAGEKVSSMTPAGLGSFWIDVGQPVPVKQEDEPAATLPTNSPQKQPRAVDAKGGVLIAGQGGAEQEDGILGLAFTADGELVGPGQELTLRSGTIVSADGLIVTSDLPAKVKHLEVTLVDGRKLEAKLMVRDERFQLSLLKVDAENLPLLQPADAAAAAGQPVMSCAAVDGKSRVVSSGIVSAIGRIVGNRLPPLIQTDVQAGEAGAGGPLVDTDGRLVGIILSRETAGGAGATFVVPAEHVRALLSTARGEQTVVIERPRLGVQLEDDTTVVEEVVPDSSAAKAGMQKGDVIVEVSGAPVGTAQDVVARIVQLQPGAEVPLKVQRGAQVVLLKAVLSPQDAQVIKSESFFPMQSHLRLEAVQPGVIWYDAAESWQRIPSIWKNNLYSVQKDGAIRVWVTPQGQEEGSAEMLKRLEEMIKNYEKSDEAKPLLKELQSIVDRQNQRRVQDRRVEELIEQVDSLRQTVESLGKQLDALSKTLKSGSK